VTTPNPEGLSSKELLAAHAELRQSKEYKDQVLRLSRSTRDFIQGITAVVIYSKRSPYLGADSFLFSQVEDLIQSVLWIPRFVEEGTFGIPRRDLRYLLEKTCVYSHLDCSFYGKSLDEKLSIFEFKKKELDCRVVRLLVLSGFSPEQKTDFCADLMRVYADLCRYVHPSYHQIVQRNKEIARHGCLGLETSDELRRFVDEVVVAFDLILALYFHALTLPLSGDVFTAYLDDYPKWKFHRLRWCKAISQGFDYKSERQSRCNVRARRV
jgi:hypothetical protein